MIHLKKELKTKFMYYINISLGLSLLYALLLVLCMVKRSLPFIHITLTGSSVSAA